MPLAPLVIKGARENNLQNIDLVLPRNQLICFTGVSGSGKSSLAYDTLHAEGQRRYVQSLSTYARQFLDQMPKPDVDQITGLSPAICISQKTGASSPRSTVGTLTEIYDYLRLLYARVGTFYCPGCGQRIGSQTVEQVVAAIRAACIAGRFVFLSPVVKEKKGEFRGVLEQYLRRGFERARIDGYFYHLDSPPTLDRRVPHRIELVVGEYSHAALTPDRLRETVKTALQLSDGEVGVLIFAEGSGDLPEEAASGAAFRAAQPDWRSVDGNLPTGERTSSVKELWYSSRYVCPQCGESFSAPSPQLFSFNHPAGACPECAGLGVRPGGPERERFLNEGLSLKEGAIVLLGPLGLWDPALRESFARWVGELEVRHGLKPGTIIGTLWKDLPASVQQELLFGREPLTPQRLTALGGEGSIPGEPVTPAELPRVGLLGAAGIRGVEASRAEEEETSPVELPTQVPCWACGGERLNRIARSIRLRSKAGCWAEELGRNITQLCQLPVSELLEYLGQLEVDGPAQVIAEPILREVRKRLSFLEEVGVGYLSLDRPAPTLAGGEMQRIRLATQLGRRLSGVLYVLDEPSIGLHPRDNDRLLRTLRDLRDQGNTVVVVEHDEQTIRTADYVVDFGPGAGSRGGQVVAAGTLPAILNHPTSLTGQYLAGKRMIPLPASRRPPGKEWLIIRGACHNNLKNVDVAIPLGLFVCVTGVSGSGKSSLVNDILVQLLRRELFGAATVPGKFRAVEGLHYVRNLIAIDQSPIGRTPRSNPATYTKIFDDIRQLFAELPEAKLRGFKPGRFSFNVAGGRCEACAGNGAQKLDMDFMVDLWVSCPVCEGRRFNRETLAVCFKGHSIADVLDLDVNEALTLFENIPYIRRKLETLQAVGLGYLKLGQPSTTLSGGEAQRVKLSRELVKRNRRGTLYVLDEPTTGLHFADVELLVQLLRSLVEGGSTVLVVEHNLEVIKCADWVIDLGPEGGERGGSVIATGTPEDVAGVEESHTGRALRDVLARHGISREQNRAMDRESPTGPWAIGSQESSSGDGRLRSDEAAGVRPQKAKANEEPSSTEGRDEAPSGADPGVIAVRGAREHNLQDLSVDIPRERLTVLCGPSGSGKSSLAIDTIYAEGRRRYLESLNSYARQFLGMTKPPQVDRIDGLMPAVAIEQRGWGTSPRSTVGTLTEIYDFLRVLFARQGTVFCPGCAVPARQTTQDEIVARLCEAPADAWAYILAPLSLQAGQKSQFLLRQIEELGYQRVRIDGRTYAASEVSWLVRGEAHSVEVVIDRLQPAAVSRGRLGDSVEAALRIGRGLMRVAWVNDRLPEHRWNVQTFSQSLSCPSCQRGFEPLTPQHFSFNSPVGWCPACQGHGVVDASEAGQNLLFDPALTVREILEETLRLSANPRLQAMLSTICHRHGIPLDLPWGKLSPAARRILLFGSGPRTSYTLAPTAEELKVDAKARPIEFQFRGLLAALTTGASGPEDLFAGEDQGPVRPQKIICPDCRGSRLRDVPAAVRWRDRTIFELCQWPLEALLSWFEEFEPPPAAKPILEELLREIRTRLRFLVEVGLEYLTLSRSAPTLSGGEIQRIRLAAQLGSGLCGVLYVLDEPTVGLHPRDGARLVGALKNLRDLGNTLLVVEHDPQVVENADYILDFGPGAGTQGGQIMAQGTPQEVKASPTSVTGPYLRGDKTIPIPSNRRMSPLWERLRGRHLRAACAPASGKRPAATNPSAGPLVPVPEVLLPPPPGEGWLIVRGARRHNLKEIDVRIPLGTLTVITGVSGSGKTTMIQEILYPGLAHALHHAESLSFADCDGIEGLELVDKVIRVDQRPIGQSPLSVPATYTGVFDLIRQLYAELPEAKARHLSPRAFSFNHPDGACWSCNGYGAKYIRMHFLPDLEITCDVCGGKRYNEHVLQVRYRGYSIAEVLELSAGEALRIFGHIAPIRRILQTLCEVGLDYLPLGQPAPTLSGGEAQRVKLAAELARPSTGRTVYILDEPTTGLHFDDLVKLIEVLQRLVDLGNTVIVIEHNLELVKVADWVIDLGPEGGERGGYLVAEGTPEDIVQFARWYADQAERATRSAQARKSVAEKRPSTAFPFRCYTGEYLEPVLAAGIYQERQRYQPPPAEEQSAEAALAQWAHAEKPPWELDGRSWHLVGRVDRAGQPCVWEGQLLERVVDFLEGTGKLAAPIWNKKTVVEIYGPGKPHRFFFQAITCERYAVRMLFYTAPEVVKNCAFVAQFTAKATEKRRGAEGPKFPQVLVHAPKDNWQCVEICAAKLAEVDIPGFWEFVGAALDGYYKALAASVKVRDAAQPIATPASRNKGTRQSSLSPASTQQRLARSAEHKEVRRLNRKWHFCRKGFPPGKRPLWPRKLLREVVQILKSRGLMPRWKIAPYVDFGRKSYRSSGPVVRLSTKISQHLLMEVFLPPLGDDAHRELSPEENIPRWEILPDPCGARLKLELRSDEPTVLEAVAATIDAAVEAWLAARSSSPVPRDK